MTLCSYFTNIYFSWYFPILWRVYLLTNCPKKENTKTKHCKKKIVKKIKIYMHFFYTYLVDFYVLIVLFLISLSCWLRHVLVMNTMASYFSNLLPCLRRWCTLFIHVLIYFIFIIWWTSLKHGRLFTLYFWGLVLTIVYSMCVKTLPWAWEA